MCDRRDCDDDINHNVGHRHLLQPPTDKRLRLLLRRFEGSVTAPLDHSRTHEEGSSVARSELSLQRLTHRAIKRFCRFAGSLEVVEYRAIALVASRLLDFSFCLAQRWLLYDALSILKQFLLPTNIKRTASHLFSRSWECANLSPTAAEPAVQKSDDLEI
jgi:hypothetical protein